MLFFVLQEFVLFLTGDITELGKILLSFFVGGTAPGSYYYPVMIQSLIMFPIIYFLIKEYDLKGLRICGYLNFLYKVLQRVSEMPEGCYRLLFFRYILVVAFGCWLAIGKYKYKLVMFIVGIIFIFLNCYEGYQPKIIVYWTRTSFMACFYIIPI